MKSKTAFKIDAGWWGKERPEGLGKPGDALEKALAGVEKAEGSLKRPSAAAIRSMERALDALEDAGRDVAREAKSLLKAKRSDRDRERERALKNTAAAMEKPLSREIEAIRDRLEEIEAEMAEAENDDELVDPRRHAAYISGLSGKLKRKQHNFCLVLQSNDPADMRIMFHRRKGGRSLVGRMKRALMVKKFTFGIAGAQRLGAELGDDTIESKTLVLYVEGRRIPSLARRVKAMLKRLGVSTFARVKVFEKGVEIESADDATPEQVAEIDLDTPDDDDDVPEGPPEIPTAGPVARKAKSMASEEAARLRSRLAKAQSLLSHLPAAKARTLRDLSALARQRIATGAVGAAERVIGALEARVAQAGRRGSPPRAADAPARVIRRELKALTEAAMVPLRHPSAAAVMLDVLPGGVHSPAEATKRLAHAKHMAEVGRVSAAEAEAIALRQMLDELEAALAARAETG